MTQFYRKILPHMLVAVFYVITALLFFSPVLQGKMIWQSDIIQYIGMSEERDQLREQGIEAYWTNAAFGGMPTYQLGAHYPNDLIKVLDRGIRFLPRPADYLFLYLIGCYLLLLVLRVPWKVAGIGALAFGFSTYLIIILGVGHNAKAHAIGYFPFVISGALLLFRKEYGWGLLVSALAIALEVQANHFQMTYYLGFLLACLAIAFAVYSWKQGELSGFLRASALLLLAGILGLGANATNLMATREYATWSTRGSTDLSTNPDGSPLESASGLDTDYITEYSYGIAESLNLIVPGLFGGSNSESLGTDSSTYAFLLSQGVPAMQASEFASALPLYWGEQPIVAAPAYIGAVVFLFFLLSLFLVKGKHKWWLLLGVILSLLLSWGKNFPALTNWMIDHFPLYNKFRAVSSIQVLLELCVPVLAFLGVSVFLKEETDTKTRFEALKKSAVIAGVILIGLFLGKGSFDFVGGSDAYYANSFGQDFVDQLIKDRKNLYQSDLMRSAIFMMLALAFLYSYHKKWLKLPAVIGALGILLLLDLGGVAKRYVTTEDFVSARQFASPFEKNYANLEIAKDTGYFRVYDTREGLNGARTSYFHRSVGGYHAAKPGRLQELFQYQVQENNLSVLNMLNTRYLIQYNEKGQAYPARNPMALGPAWFVENLIGVSDADAEMAALDTLDVSVNAVFDSSEYPDFKAGSYVKDSLSRVEILRTRPDDLLYKVTNNGPGLLVFSEMHYPHGWKAMIDENVVPILRVNYALRAIEVPEGTHKIRFVFEPQVVKTGSTITLTFNILLLLLLIGVPVYYYRTKNRT